MEFTSWEIGLGLNPDELEHHGIPGMKWGVRRFQNKDGSLTAAGEKRYGHLSLGGSPRSMTRHFNKLDKGYANVEARRRDYASKAGKLTRKAHKAEAKGNEKKAEKLHGKAMKQALKAAEANQQKKAIESLQWRIIGKAAMKGYTVNSKPVQRAGITGKTRVAAILGGAAGVTLYSAIRKGRNMTQVSGQNIKVSRRGNRTQSVVNYASARSSNVRNIMREERDREIARQFANARR